MGVFVHSTADSTAAAAAAAATTVAAAAAKTTGKKAQFTTQQITRKIKDTVCPTHVA